MKPIASPCTPTATSHREEDPAGIPATPHLAHLLVLLALLALAAIVVCVGPLWDWFAIWLLGMEGNPLVQIVMPLFKWLWLIIALSVTAAFAYVYLVVIRKIRYNRLMGELE